MHVASVAAAVYAAQAWLTVVYPYMYEHIRARPARYRNISHFIEHYRKYPAGISFLGLTYITCIYIDENALRIY